MRVEFSGFDSGVNRNVLLHQNSKLNFKSRMINSTVFKNNAAIYKSSSSLFNLLNKILNFCKSREKKLPIIDKAYLSNILSGLQNENEFYADVAKHNIKGNYVSSDTRTIAEVIKKLESKNVIEAQKSWESPRFLNGTLVDSHYEDIIAKIKAAPNYILNNYEKKDFINTLARSTHHNDDIIFGEITFKGDDAITEHVDSATEHCDSILDTILDFLDDLF